MALQAEKLNPNTAATRQALQGFSAAHKRAIEQGLSMFIQGKEEETRVMQARRILGESVTQLSDEDLEVKVSAIQYLVECWADSFEKSIFNNQTLRQVMKGE
jgi:hypothetical protein